MAVLAINNSIEAYSQSSTRSSERRYLCRLRKYQPPRHVDLGLRDFCIPQRKIYRHAGVLGDKGVAAKKHHKTIKSFSSSISVKKIKGKNKKTTKHCGSKKPQKKKKNSSSHSSTSSKCKRNCHCEKKKHNCKNKCCKKGCKRSRVVSKVVPISSSSSSSASRSVSLDIFFSQEDAAILGSCDQPAVAVHSRHYSRRLRRSESHHSRSRSRSRSVVAI